MVNPDPYAQAGTHLFGKPEDFRYPPGAVSGTGSADIVAAIQNLESGGEEQEVVAPQWFVDGATNTYIWGVPDETTDPVSWTYYDKPDGTLLATQPTDIQPVKTNSATAQYSHEFSGVAQTINHAALIAINGGSAVYSVDIDIRTVESPSGAPFTRGSATDFIHATGTRSWRGERTDDNLLFPATDFALTLTASDIAVLSWAVIL